MRIGNHKALFSRIIPCFGLCLFVAKLVSYLAVDYGALRTQGAWVPLDVFFWMNVVGIVVFLLLVWRPYLHELYGLLSLSYVVPMLIDDSNLILAVGIYGLAVVCLYARGYFVRRKKLKLVLVSLVPFILLGARFRFGMDAFVNTCFDFFAFLLTCTVALVVLYENTIRPVLEFRKQQCLDLSAFPKLTSRDKEWILLFLDFVPYTGIAKQYGLSLGAVKKRAREIFSIMGVPDLHGFIAKYSNMPVKGLSSSTK